MKLTVCVGDERQLVLPATVIERLRLNPGTKVDVEIQTSTDPAPYQFDAERFDRAVAKYRGSLREKFLADGWSSVDEYMDDIRPQW